MMKMSDVLAWIKSFDFVANNYYIGANDKKKEKSIGLYPLKAGQHFVPIGGLSYKINHEKRISILVHWTKSFNETESAAIELFEELERIENAQIGKYTVSYVELLTEGPVDVQRDDNGIFEQVIDFVIHYVK